MEAQSCEVTSLRSHSHEDAGLAFEARSSGARVLSLSHKLTKNSSKTPSLSPCLGLDVSRAPPLTRSHGLISVMTAVMWFCDRKTAAGSGSLRLSLMPGIAPGAE